MLIGYCIIVTYLVKHVTVMNIQSKKVNIKGKQVEHPENSRNLVDYKKYYKELFQPMDIHPQLYGNKLNSTKSNIVRDNFNDDVEHDKHTLIFQQVYNFYKKMLSKRKSETNSKINRVLKSKNKVNAHIDILERAMKKKLKRFEHNNHKEIVKTRMQLINQESNISEALTGNDALKDHSKGIDTFKIQSILNEVENFVQTKVTNKFNSKQHDDEVMKEECLEDETEKKGAKEIKNDFKNDLKGKIQNFFGINKGSSVRTSRKVTKTKKTTTTRPTTPNLEQWALNHTDYDDETVPTCRGDGYWDQIKNRRINLTRRARLKTTWSSDEAVDYWKAWTPDPRYTFGLEEWNGSAVMNQTFFSYEEENATFTTLPANWLTWLYSGVSEDLANQTTYESCPTHEIYDRYYNTTWSLEFEHTPAKNATMYWPNKDMFKYNFHTSDASEWHEKELYNFPPNPTYYQNNLVTEYLTWRPIKRADFITTKRQYSTWTELFYTNNSAEGLYVAPTVYWIDMRTPSKRTYGSWEQVESYEVTKPPTTLPPYPNPPINFTCYHCNGTPAIFSHENNLENHILEHMKNDTYKVHYNSSEERRARTLPVWDGTFMLSQDSDDKRRGIKQTRYPDCTYLETIDYAHAMRDWNQSFIDRMKKRHEEGKSIGNWDQDSVVYQYYENLRPTTVFYDSDYYYTSEEWKELQVERKKKAEREKLMKSLKEYMSQNLTTFPDSLLQESEEFEKQKKAKIWPSAEAFKREYLRNLTRTTLKSHLTTTIDPYLDVLKDLATIYQQYTSVTPTTKRKRPYDNLQDQINQYVYSMDMDTLAP